jgi:predicted esterase
MIADATPKTIPLPTLPNEVFGNGRRGLAFGGMPILLSVGEDDDWVPVTRVRETAAVFGASGADVRSRVRPGSDHVVSDEERAAFSALLDGLLASVT